MRNAHMEKSSIVKKMLAAAKLNVDTCHTTHRFCEDAESPWACNTFLFIRQTGRDQCQPYSSILYKCHTKPPWKGCTVSINIIMKPLKINTCRHAHKHICCTQSWIHVQLRTHKPMPLNTHQMYIYKHRSQHTITINQMFSNWGGGIHVNISVSVKLCIYIQPSWKTDLKYSVSANVLGINNQIKIIPRLLTSMFPVAGSLYCMVCFCDENQRFFNFFFYARGTKYVNTLERTPFLKQKSYIFSSIKTHLHFIPCKVKCDTKNTDIQIFFLLLKTNVVNRIKPVLESQI